MSKPISDELFIRRFLAKTSFVFGLAIGFLAGIVACLHGVHP
jgi:hypothetical protein